MKNTINVEERVAHNKAKGYLHKLTPHPSELEICVDSEKGVKVGNFGKSEIDSFFLLAFPFGHCTSLVPGSPKLVFGFQSNLASYGMTAHLS